MDNDGHTAESETISSSDTASTLTECPLPLSDTSTPASTPTEYSLTNETNTNDEVNNDLGDYKASELTLGCQIKPDLDTFGIQTGPLTFTPVTKTDNMQYEKKNDSGETYFQVKMESIMKLKNSTKKLLCLVEDIQSKTHSSATVPDDTPRLSTMLKSFPSSDQHSTVSATDLLTSIAMRNLEVQASNLDEIFIQDEEDDCSIFKRLTRKCHCLNHKQYNDFIIHFNEDTKHFTSTLGEIIKNLRILKKFMYIGGGYTKNALSFLNEGLTQCPHHEKVEIVKACSYADVCNVFEEHSMVAVYLAWPCRHENCGDSMTQALTASLLLKLAQIEEGRRYLTFSSKITNDIKRLLRKDSSKLESATLETLNATVNLLNPPLTRHINVTYYCKAEEGMGQRTLHALARYRMHMTLDEVFTHLELVNSMSDHDAGKKQLMQHLPNLLIVFKQLLIEYDSPEINRVLTNILNNLVAKNPLKHNESELIKTFIVSDMCTEPIPTISEVNQVPSIKKANKKTIRSKLRLSVPINKSREPCKRKVGESSLRQHQSQKLACDLGSSVVVEPIDKKTVHRKKPA